ncbi:MAG: response regulator [Caldilineales bacterium]
MNDKLSNNLSPSPSQAASTPSGRRILVVEDNRELRDFMRRILQRYGYQYMDAEDGIQAVETAKTAQPDLILMDIALPELNGYGAARLLKTLPECAHIPIIAVTAHAREVDRKQALEMGCDAYLSKPYSLHDLMALIEEFLPHPKST